MPTPLNKELRQYVLVRRPEGRDPTLGLLTIAEVAALRGVGYGACIRDVWNGRLPAWSIGGMYLIPYRDAEDWANRPKDGGGGRRKMLQRVNRALDKQVDRDVEAGKVYRRALDPEAERIRPRPRKKTTEDET